MRIIILIPFFLLAMVAGYSQQLHFAYLQTDTHTPFYVTLNKKNYSSTASGYIILPKLQNGDYPLRIGFAKNEVAEQDYLLQVKDNDQGFLIKDFGDKGWTLFNLQSMAVQYAGTAAQERAKLAAAEKAEADLRQSKLLEEAQAAETQRRNDSLKSVAIAQQNYADSVAAGAVSNRQRMYEDSLKSVAFAQQTYTDSVTAAAISIRQRMYEDSVANEQNLMKQRRFMDSVANAKVVVKEAERPEKIADSVTGSGAKVIETQNDKAKVAVKIEKENGTIALPDNDLPLKKEPVKSIPVPVLIHQLFTDSGWHYAYNIINNNKRETVNVFIPSAQPKPPVNTTVIEQKEMATADTVKTDSVKSLNTKIGQDTASASKKEGTVGTPASNDPIIAVTAVTPQAEAKDSTSIIAKDNTPMVAEDSMPMVTERPLLNRNCKETASEKDFLTARKKIAAAFGTDAMLVAAKKVLKKCYTTEQLRNLCVLFLTDTGRYLFLDMAYPVASDAYNFATLQDLLIDAYFIQRFKAMVR